MTARLLSDVVRDLGVENFSDEDLDLFEASFRRLDQHTDCAICNGTLGAEHATTWAYVMGQPDP